MEASATFGYLCRGSQGTFGNEDFSALVAVP